MLWQTGLICDILEYMKMCSTLNGYSCVRNFCRQDLWVRYFGERLICERYSGRHNLCAVLNDKLMCGT